MALLSDFESATQDVDKTVNKAYGNGKLEKACIAVYKKTGNTYAVDKNRIIEVQFNPSEYSIRRGAKLSDKRPLQQDATPGDVQAVQGEPSIFSVSLYFDSYTELLSKDGSSNTPANSAADNSKAGLPSFDMNEETAPDADYRVNKLFGSLLGLIKYAHEEHEPPHIGFIWGEYLNFVGKLSSYNVSYTVFGRDGMPVRAKMDMTIVGEDNSFVLKKSERPLESPDRTKQRTLHYGDQLWMMAREEYGDAAQWKTIAAANGILNPRAIGGVMRLKVPSIR